MRKKKFLIPNYFFLIICITPLLIFYVSIHLKVIQAGYQLEKLEKEYNEIEFINKTYKAKILELTNPDNLKQLSNKLGLNFISPEKWCYVDIKKKNEENEGVIDNAYAETRQ